jgi:hypothetical protein
MKKSSLRKHTAARLATGHLKKHSNCAASTILVIGITHLACLPHPSDPVSHADIFGPVLPVVT